MPNEPITNNEFIKNFVRHKKNKKMKNIEEKKFNSKGMLIGIWLSFISCLIMGGIDMLFYSPHNVDSRAITFMAMSYPFIFVCCMFMTFRTKIIVQDDKIKELEDKIKQIV